MNMDLYRIFYEVATCGNITKASKKLNISQPAVTKHIKNLEKYLDVILFIRTRKGVVLTPIGKSIFLDIKNSLNILDNVSNKIKNYNEYEYGEIKIGVGTSLVKYLLCDIIKEFHNKYPNINIEINTDMTRDNIKSLEEGLLDIVICKKPEKLDNDLIFTKIYDTSYEFICDKNYYHKINKPCKVDELIQYPLIFQKKFNSTYQSLDNFFKENNIEIDSKINIGSSSLLIEFVKMGFGIGYVTKLYALEELNKKNVFIINTVPKTPNVEIGFITLKNNIMSNALTKFVNYLLKNK